MSTPTPAASPWVPTEAEFWDFAKTVPVASRDQGFVPITPWGSQRKLVSEIFAAIREGQRQLYILKAGQLGITTILLILSAYWYSHSDGLQGVFVADSDDLRDYFRDQFTLMIQHGGDEVLAAYRANNRTQVAWPNGSRLLFQTSGVRSGSRLGIGRGVAWVHGSELGLWQNPRSLTYLRTRWSDKHPHRLLLLEGTPRGHNWWFDLWEDAAEAIDIRRVFLPWWLREDYRLSPDSPEFHQYWDKRLNRREQLWVKEVERRYQATLEPEQLAWRRWYEAEKAGGDARVADQEMATIPEEAFEATGECFLQPEVVRRHRKSVRTAGKAKYYRYEFGATLDESEVRPTTAAMADLTVWGEPMNADAYVVSAVPAHSASPKCATSVVSVWKATRDDLEQVAEATSTAWGLQTFSWVCWHLLGGYRVPRRAFILEVSGPGLGVLQELKRAQASGWGLRHPTAAPLRQLVGPLRHYLWRRPDSMGGGAAMQWKSDGSIQGWVIRRLRDQLESGSVRIRSADLLQECERLRAVEDSFESEGRTCEEHRLMSAALAVEAWAAQLRPLFARVQGKSEASTSLDRLMEGFFRSLGKVTHA